MSKIDAILQTQLAHATAKQVRRQLTRCQPAGAGEVLRAGQRLWNFSSNDYLGLSQHPALIERARAWTSRWGAGAGASRLVSGTLEIHAEVEAKLAALKGTEAALLLASGWQANAAVLPALFAAVSRPHAPLVFCDRLNHASLHMGCQAAGVRQIRYRHNDLAHLDALLTERADQPGMRFIITESVFSMDGDRSDVPALAALAQRHHAFLYLDDAHATGVLGRHGMGLGSHEPGVDLIMGTFSKAMGGYGAYVAGSQVLCDYLVNHCSGFIYTTALPPAMLGAIDAALDLIPTLDAQRARLQTQAQAVRQCLQELGCDTRQSSTQIVPAVIGDAAAALAAAESLRARGCLTIPIRPPTVPVGTSRLRLTLSAAHPDAAIAQLLSALRATLPGAQT